MRSFFGTVILCRQCGSTDKYIAHTNFTSTVALSVISGKTFNENTCKFGLTIQENTIIRNKNIIKYCKCFHSAINCVAQIKFTAFCLSCIAALTSNHHHKTFRIQRNRKGYGIIFIIRSHGNCRHNKDLM